MALLIFLAHHLQSSTVFRHFKGPKHEIFVTKLFTQSKPVFVDDLKMFGPDICDFVILAHAQNAHKIIKRS
jgi:hypothetical protein